MIIFCNLDHFSKCEDSHLEMMVFLSVMGRDMSHSHPPSGLYSLKLAGQFVRHLITPK